MHTYAYRYKIDKKIPPESQIITAEPDVTSHTISDDDEFIVIACDGVWDCMTNQVR
jgi:protein phosphatase 2C family protein 2/3